MSLAVLNTDIDRSKRLSAQEYAERLQEFEELMPNMRLYIRREAARKAKSIPVSYVTEDDLVGIGNIQTWIAVLRWDRESSLARWARRLIWTHMDVIVQRLYDRKRTARTEVQGSEVTVSPVSLDSMDNQFAADSTDPIESLIAEDVYNRAREHLLRKDMRVAVGVLRVLVFPDDELRRICVVDAVRKGKRQVRMTAYCIALRLGLPVYRIVRAKKVVREVVKELLYD